VGGLASSGSAAPGSPIDKKQSDDQYEQEDREPVGTGKVYQVSELFEISMVSDGGRPTASSSRTTRLASAYES
jgi:hypothetical protein